MTPTELNSALAAGGIALPPDAVEKLCDYARLLIEQNRTMNLIGPATEPELATRHFLDSLAPLMPAAERASKASAWEKSRSDFDRVPRGTSGETGRGSEIALAFDGRSLIDVGSGAGFPGMALAIALPRLRVTLCDSLAKRTAFLARTAEALDLPNVKVITARAEELAHTAARESFDFAAARAVTATPALCELCLPLLRVGGTMLAYKTARAADEIADAARAVKILGGRMLAPYEYAIPDPSGEPIPMRLQPIRKAAPTPPAYPRPWGKIKAKPL